MRLLHPILMDEMDKHRERIASVILKKEEKKPYAEKIEQAYLDILEISLKDENYDKADILCAEIGKYHYPEQLQLLVDKLLDDVFQLDTEEALQTLEEIRE